MVQIGNLYPIWLPVCQQGVRLDYSTVASLFMYIILHWPLFTSPLYIFWSNIFTIAGQEFYSLYSLGKLYFGLQRNICKIIWQKLYWISRHHSFGFGQKHELWRACTLSSWCIRSEDNGSWRKVLDIMHIIAHALREKLILQSSSNHPITILQSYTNDSPTLI